MSKRAARVALLLIAMLVSSIVSGSVNPASACGCGAMVANDKIRIEGESSIVRWFGQIEALTAPASVWSATGGRAGRAAAAVTPPAPLRRGSASTATSSARI